MLDQITPVILTYNEANNIGRTLQQLRWAKRVVIVNNHSVDDTAAIAKSFPNVEIFDRRFDTHARQWDYAVNETGITTPWVVTLDADFYLPQAFIDELAALTNDPAIDAYAASFVYCIFGQPLRATVFPPFEVLCRRDRVTRYQDGHTMRVKIAGRTAALTAKIHHDDRKPMGRWLQNQDQYMRLEAAKIAAARWTNLDWPDRVRTWLFVSPFLMFAYSLVVKGGIFDGKAGLHYALQRLVAEAILSMHLIELKLLKREQFTSGTDHVGEATELRSKS